MENVGDYLVRGTTACSKSSLLTSLTSDADLRVAQVRVVFSLTEAQRETLFGDAHTTLPVHFAYIEWFSKFSTAPGLHHRMYKVKRAYEVGFDIDQRHAEIIAVNQIRCGIHLFPVFGPSAVPLEWTSESVLDECENFYVNPFTSLYVYLLLHNAE